MSPSTVDNLENISIWCILEEGILDKIKLNTNFNLRNVAQVRTLRYVALEDGSSQLQHRYYVLKT